MDFRTLERDAWGDPGVAAGYEQHFLDVTTQAIGPLLDAAAVGPGKRVLDVATGPGDAAAQAAARGAAAVGLDFSAAMLDGARRRHPGVDFRAGDATALPFPDGSFDAVVCNFGLLHFHDPDAALREAARVLRPGGMAAFTVWARDAAFLTLATEAMAALGLQPKLPEGPPFFRFAEPGSFEAAFRAAGLHPAAPRRVAWTFAVPTPHHHWMMLVEGTARTRAALLALTHKDRERVRAELARRLEAHRKGTALELPASAVVGSARKP